MCQPSGVNISAGTKNAWNGQGDCGIPGIPVLASREQEFGQGDASWDCATCKAVQDQAEERHKTRQKQGHSGAITSLFSYVVFTICNMNNSQHFAMQQSFLSKELCYTYYCCFPRYTNPNKSPKVSKGFSLCLTLLQLETTFSGSAEIRKHFPPATFIKQWHCEGHMASLQD